MPFKHLSTEEIRLARMWHNEDEKAPSVIAELLHRDKATITRLLFQRPEEGKGAGRKKMLSEADVTKLETKLATLVKAAKGKYEVTAAMLRKSARVKACVRTIANALHKRRIYFRPFRNKPVLTASDVAGRKEFAKKNGDKSKAWWRTHVHMHIDVKHFPVYVNGAGRQHAARQGTRGAYRKPGQGLEAPYVKSAKNLKYNTGVRGVKVLAGVGCGKVLVWEYLDGKRWNGGEAAKMYEGPIRKALDRAYPHRKSWTILEDNDPTGFKSSKGLKAKSAAGIKVFSIPQRSPDLNVCDYALWAEVNKRMRRQEEKWSADKRETRKHYLARLRRTALRLPTSFIEKSVGDMTVRCKRLRAAEGKHFPEGAEAA